MKPAKKLFVYKLKLSYAVINLADMIINTLSWIFYGKVLNTKRISDSFWRNITVRAEKKYKKFYLSVRKRDGRKVIYAPKL